MEAPTQDSGSYAITEERTSVDDGTDDPPLVPGTTFARRYRIERLIGEGGMGRVYLATDTTIYEPIAIKFVSGSRRSDANFLEQFKRELKLARKIRHRNVVASFHLGEAEGRIYITQEYIESENISAKLARTGTFSEREALALLRQILGGLKAAHDLGIVHRDIKASNILVNKDGMAFITDFGLAMSTAAAGLVLGGTPQYMAPELFETSSATPSTDLYACGVLLFHMLTATFPFERHGFDLFTLAGELDAEPKPIPDEIAVAPATRDICLRMVARDPLDRPQLAMDVLEVVDGVLALDALTITTERPIALVADADEAVRRIARTELEHEGYHVEAVSNAREVVDLAFSVTPSVVVFDSNVEGGDELAFAAEASNSVTRDIFPQHAGLGLCSLLQHDSRLKRVPIVVMTAKRHPGLTSAFMLVGASEVISKPFNGEQLAAGIKSALRTALTRAEAGV
jgi:serine/threonine protein kinase